MSQYETDLILDQFGVEDQHELVSRYRRLRLVGTELNNSLVSRLGRGTMEEGGKKLGLFKRGTFVFESEDQMPVLMDYCIYNIYRKGRNAADQFLLDSPPPDESDEMRCIEAMQRGFYSLFAVESVIQGLGVIARDLFSDRSILLVDMGFGSTASPGLVLASRILVHDGFCMTAGAALPVGLLSKPEQDAFVKSMDMSGSASTEGVMDPAPLIRACLKRGASSRVRYQDAGGTSPGGMGGPGRQSSGKPGRNSHCPCGSGKKYKQCCLKKVKWENAPPLPSQADRTASSAGAQQTSIPAEVRQQAEEVIASFNKKISARGKVKYIARFQGDCLYLDRSDRGQSGPICRLTYTGDFENWEFAIFKFSSETYDPSEWMFPGAEEVDGSIEGAMRAGLEAYPP